MEKNHNDFKDYHIPQVILSFSSLGSFNLQELWEGKIASELSWELGRMPTDKINAKKNIYFRSVLLHFRDLESMHISWRQISQSRLTHMATTKFSLILKEWVGSFRRQNFKTPETSSHELNAFTGFLGITTTQ
jgi:hypothetical protein